MTIGINIGKTDMGLAASQARLLNLTVRMHQIEYKAAKLEAEKLQMANESRRVYEEYCAALEDTKVQYKTLNTDGSFTYQDIRRYEDFLAAGFALDFRGTVYDGSDEYRSASGDRITVELATQAELVANGFDIDEAVYKVTKNGNVEYLKDNGSFSPPFDGVATYDGVEFSKVTLDYAQLCADAFKADLNYPPEDVSEVLTNLINSGHVTIVERRKDQTFAKEEDEDFNFFETSVPTNTGLQEVADEKELKKAEAKYEAEMRKIDFKDRTFDRELSAIEQERNAIKQEMETLKTVAKDNVERTFKLFG